MNPLLAVNIETSRMTNVAAVVERTTSAVAVVTSMVTMMVLAKAGGTMVGSRARDTMVGMVTSGTTHHTLTMVTVVAVGGVEVGATRTIMVREDLVVGTQGGDFRMRFIVI